MDSQINRYLDSRQKNKIIIILGSLSAIGPFSIDMYLPGFPAVARDLGTDIEHVALSLSSYFVGISAGQLLYGPLLDRFGRKKPLLFGLALYAAAAIACAFAPSINALIALRLLQALGACAGMVAGRAVVRDLFHVNETAKIFSTLMLVMGIAPIIAPSIGGIVTSTLGWRYIFLLLTLFATAMLVTVARFFPESKSPDASVSLRIDAVFHEYRIILRTPSFVTYAVAGGLVSAGMFAYISGASFVFMNVFGFTAMQFGQFFAVNAFGLVAGSQLNTLWLRKRKSAQIVPIVGGALFAVTIALSASNYLTGGSLTGTIVSLFFYLPLLGFMNPNTAALSLAPFTKNAGSASALLGAVQMLAGAGASALVSALHNGTVFPMIGVMTGCAGIGYLIIITHPMRIAERPGA